MSESRGSGGDSEPADGTGPGGDINSLSTTGGRYNAVCGPLFRGEKWFKQVAEDAFRFAAWVAQALLALHTVILGMQLGFGVKTTSPSVLLLAALFTLGLLVLVACLATASAAAITAKTGLAGRLSRHARNGGGFF